ncbi:MAG TPA: porin [Firmicutes bacterium]|nr:porin [Bacillota bacterium]
MKKALVLALTVLMVLSLATAAFAAEVTYEGKVEVTFGGSSEGEAKEAGEFGGNKEAKVIIDFAKDFGDGVTAGVKTVTEAHGDEKKFEFDGEGYVKVEKDLFTAEASTGIDGGVGKDFGEFNIANNPGLGLELKLIDGLTINTIVNNKRQADPEKSDFNFVLKGEFAQDIFTVGGGFQSDGENKTSAFGVYGSANPIDDLTVNAEFGSRNLDTEDNEADAITSLLASAEYKLDALTAKAGFLMNDIGFKSLNDDDADQDYRINEAFRFVPVYKVNVLFVDASYQIMDNFEVNGNFDYLLGAKDDDDEDLPDDAIEKLSFKVGAKYTYDALTFEGWYKAWDASQFGGKASYNLADGVDTSFEVTMTKDDKDDEDAKLAYTAKVEASL